MERIYRELSNDTKKKISDSMQNYHHKLTDFEKEKINRKKSESLKRYWAGIPNKKEDTE
jgi:hypothetical protein